jgi:hypothetical protein
MRRRLDALARKRYAKSLRGLATRPLDACRLAIHLRDALPAFASTEIGWGLGLATTIYRCADIVKTDVPLSPHGDAIAAAALVGGVTFRYVAPDGIGFTVIVVKDGQVVGGSLDVEVPAFITSPSADAISADGNGDDSDDERDCNELSFSSLGHRRAGCLRHRLARCRSDVVPAVASRRSRGADLQAGFQPAPQDGVVTRLGCRREHAHRGLLAGGLRRLPGGRAAAADEGGVGSRGRKGIPSPHGAGRHAKSGGWRG